MTTTVIDMFAATAAKDPTRPILTFYDDVSGDRTELSGATLTNWVAKTANLLVDGLGLGTGELAGVLLPPHWQTAAVLLGCWSAGLEVDYADDGKSPVEVLFAAADRVATAGDRPAGDRFALALAPMAMPLRVVPPGFLDYVVEVRGQGDRFTPVTPGGAELGRLAVGRAAELGLGTGDRVLVDADRHPDPLDWLLAPLAVGASLVLCVRLDPDRLDARAAAEKVTVRLG